MTDKTIQTNSKLQERIDDLEAKLDHVTERLWISETIQAWLFAHLETNGSFANGEQNHFLNTSANRFEENGRHDLSAHCDDFLVEIDRLKKILEANQQDVNNQHNR